VYGKGYHLNSSRHVKSHQDEEREYDDLTRPEQLNVPTTEQQRHSMNFVQTIPSQSSINTYLRKLPATAPGISRNTHAQNRIHRVRAPSVPSETQRLVRQGYDSISWPAYRKANAGLTNNLGHSWSNLVMGGYPLAYANDAVVRLIHARNAKSMFLIFTAASPEHSGATGL
jgi:hypothetical protein